MTFESVIIFAGIVFLMAIIPGPNALLVLFTSLAKNRAMAFANVAGVAVGFMIHAFISALGLSLLITQSEAAFTALQWLGAVYLLWLGGNHIKAGIGVKPLVLANAHPMNGIGRNFLKGLLTNLLNPKIVLFYLSIFPQFVNQNAVMTESLILGLVQAVVVSLWFFTIILLAENVKAFFTNSENARRLNFLSGGIFIAFSAKLASAEL